MIRVEASDWHTFHSVFSQLYAAGVVETPVGGNAVVLRDDTSVEILHEVAAIPGVTVWSDQPIPDIPPAEPRVEFTPTTPAKRPYRRTREEQ